MEIPDTFYIIKSIERQNISLLRNRREKRRRMALKNLKEAQAAPKFHFSLPER